MNNKIISIDTLKHYNDKISNYVDEKVSNAVDNLELDELNAILVDTDVEADDPIIPDYVTETELNTALSNKMDKVTLAKVATSGNYNDLTNKPTIPAAVTESTVAGWGFTKNTGTYSKPSGGIPKSDLTSAVQTSLGKADTALQSYTEQYKGTITGVSANGTSVATSGVANIPAASTSAYGVIKLSSATNSTSTTKAATPSAVKAAYDLANSYKGTVTGVKINGTTKNPSSGVVDLGTVITAHQTLKTINGQSIIGSGDITISGGGSDENTIIMLYLNNTPYVGETGVFPSITAFDFANAINNHYIFYVYTGSDLVLPCSVWGDRIYIFNGPIYIDLLITKNFVDDTVEWECIEEAEIQKKLVSGTNIKTINGTSILGSGDIVISGGGGSSSGREDIRYFTEFTVEDFIEACESGSIITYDTTDLFNAMKSNKVICVPYRGYDKGFVVASYKTGESTDYPYIYLQKGDIEYYAWTGDSYELVGEYPIYNSVQIVDLSNEADVMIEVHDNHIYRLSSPVNYLFISLYMIEKGTTLTFMSGDDGTTIESPILINWANGVAPNIEPNTIYELSLISSYDYSINAVLTPFKPAE